MTIFISGVGQCAIPLTLLIVILIHQMSKMTPLLVIPGRNSLLVMLFHILLDLSFLKGTPFTIVDIVPTFSQIKQQHKLGLGHFPTSLYKCTLWVVHIYPARQSDRQSNFNQDGSLKDASCSQHNDSGGEYTNGEESAESDDLEAEMEILNEELQKRALKDNGEKEIVFKMPGQPEVQNHQCRTSNPIYLFCEQVPLNTDGQSGASGNKHYKCSHGKCKIITVKKTMKSCITGLTYHLKSHFSAMFRLYKILHQCSEPPTSEEIKIASGKKALNPKDCGTNLDLRDYWLNGLLHAINHLRKSKGLSSKNC
ncbi:hypothetical protein K435DRAFT_802577 [Dendrothele bispora CBS 962.96]|uniref:Uncharacterized protein n=1 Tax=Dendrothele bispora (strain CBS 962.96) TaxID=1314807 RepID=A0A4S8LL21_DENBC|nr:hypothetical protein K435DRAFT_802577 [Dendrothele bispora CBS 962.96]